MRPLSSSRRAAPGSDPSGSPRASRLHAQTVPAIPSAEVLDCRRGERLFPVKPSSSASQASTARRGSLSRSSPSILPTGLPTRSSVRFHPDARFSVPLIRRLGYRAQIGHRGLAMLRAQGRPLLALRIDLPCRIRLDRFVEVRSRQPFVPGQDMVNLVRSARLCSTPKSTARDLKVRSSPWRVGRSDVPDRLAAFGPAPREGAWLAATAELEAIQWGRTSNPQEL